MGERLGGETILYSENGLIPKIKIDPVPNRLIIFIHSANSFHGVKTYKPLENIYRKTFYHDYYIDKNHKTKFVASLNKDRQKKLIFSKNGTTFIPFFPNGIKEISIKKIFYYKF